MSKEAKIFILLALVGAIYFYRINPLISMVCFLIVVGAAFSSGRLG